MKFSLFAHMERIDPSTPHERLYEEFIALCTLADEAGMHAIVHGHRNVTRGQRIMLRVGLLHVECDTCVDANTRAQDLAGRASILALSAGTDFARRA